MHPDRLDDDSALRPRSTATELSELSDDQRRVLTAVGSGSTVSTLLDQLELPAERLRAELLALLELQLLEVTATSASGAENPAGRRQVAGERDSDAPADSEKRVVQTANAARESNPGESAEAGPSRGARPAAERDAIRPAPAIHLSQPPHVPVQQLPTTSPSMRTVPAWSSSPLRPVANEVASGHGAAPGDKPAKTQTLMGGFRSGLAPSVPAQESSDPHDSSPPTRRGYSAPPPATQSRRWDVTAPWTGATGASAEPVGIAGRTLLGFRAPLEQIASYEQQRNQLGATQVGAPTATAFEQETPLAGSSPLDAFEVLDCLAKGGRGVVYLVRERATGNNLALKVLRQDQCDSQPAIAALNREARLLEVFDHPNLVRFDRFDHEGEEPFLLMEYVEGLSAARLLHYPVPMPLDVGLTIVLDALEALFYVHDLRNVKVAPEGLVHADVSPENFLVGTDGITRLIDFGSSCGPAEFANPQRVQAKLGYASPELLRGDEVDFRSDVFSMGAVLFHILSKLPPFSADPAWREREHSVPKPSQLNPRLPKAFDSICQKALHSEPAKRYASVPELRRDFERALKAAQIECRRERVAEWVQRVRQSLRGNVEFSALEIKELLEQDPVALRRLSNAAADAPGTPALGQTPVEPAPTGAVTPAGASEAAQTGQLGAATRYAEVVDESPLSGRARLWITLFALAIAAGILYVALVQPEALNRWMPPPAGSGGAP